LPVGAVGGYFVGEIGVRGQGAGSDILDDNAPPCGQPGLWCQWIPTEDRTGIEWDGGEKFYDYVKWLRYIIEHFLARWDYVLNGSVTWEGEISGDTGTILVVDNNVTAGRGALHLLAGTAEED